MSRASGRLTSMRFARALIYVLLCSAMAGCVPVGARWQNMFGVLGWLG